MSCMSYIIPDTKSILGERRQAKSTSSQASIAAQAGPASGRVLSTDLEFLARVAGTYVA